jgi:hypothetical protein
MRPAPEGDRICLLGEERRDLKHVSKMNTVIKGGMLTLAVLSVVQFVLRDFNNLVHAVASEPHSEDDFPGLRIDDPSWITPATDTKIAEHVCSAIPTGLKCGE